MVSPGLTCSTYQPGPEISVAAWLGLLACACPFAAGRVRACAWPLVDALGVRSNAGASEHQRHIQSFRTVRAQKVADTTSVEWGHPQLNAL